MATPVIHRIEIFVPTAFTQGQICCLTQTLRTLNSHHPMAASCGPDPGGPAQSAAPHRATRDNNGRAGTEMRPYALCGCAQVSTYTAAAGWIAATLGTPEPAPHRACPGRGWRNSGFAPILCRLGLFCAPTGVHFAGGGGKFRLRQAGPHAGGLMTGEYSKRGEFTPMP